MSSAPPRKGFTLIEALAAVTLLGIGIVGSLSGIATLTRNEDAARQTETMQRMAQDKLSELVATGQADTSTDGDFSDQNIEGYTWRLETGTSGITDLNSVTLTVERTGTTQRARIDTLLYVPPVQTTAGGTAQ